MQRPVRGAEKDRMIYDAKTVGAVLGLPCDSRHLPQADDNAIVLYYGGWDLPTLSAASQQRMYQLRYDEWAWTAPPGYYACTFGPTGGSWEDQIAQLHRGFQPAPIAIATTLLLLHLITTGRDLLQHEWCRCAEPLQDGYRAALAVLDGHVRVHQYEDCYQHLRVRLCMTQFLA